MSALTRSTVAVSNAVRQFHASASSAGGEVCLLLLHTGLAPASLLFSVYSRYFLSEEIGARHDVSQENMSVEAYQKS
jgi:hypothetical protein